MLFLAFHVLIDDVFHVLSAYTRPWKSNSLLICVDNNTARQYITRRATYRYAADGRLCETRVNASADFKMIAFRPKYYSIDLFGDGLPDNLNKVAIHKLTGDSLTEQETAFYATYAAVVHNEPGAAQKAQELCMARYKRFRRGLWWEICKYRIRNFFRY